MKNLTSKQWEAIEIFQTGQYKYYYRKALECDSREFHYYKRMKEKAGKQILELHEKRKLCRALKPLKKT